MHPIRKLLAVSSLLAILPALASAAGVTAVFDLSRPETGPFPSNRFAAADLRHRTGLRVNLPRPDCTTRPSDCEDVDVLNTLDGFSLQPRLAIPFTGPIDPASVNSANLFLVGLGDTTRAFAGFGTRIGINQIVWDPASNTLFAESDALLEQHTTYVLVATNGIRDAAGDRVETSGFRHPAGISSLAARLYRTALVVGLAAARVPMNDVASASLFTTQSATAVLEKVRNQIKSNVPAHADFLLGADGSRAVFPLHTVTGIVFVRQVGTAPAFANSPVPTAALGIFPGAVGALAFGSYASPDYETAQQYIPAVGTRTGVPAVQSAGTVYFNLVLPAGPQPAGGWPVAIFGHGFGDNKQSALFAVSAGLAARGIATIGTNVVGHGGGPLGILVVNRSGGLAPVIVPAGGRGIDQDGLGSIDSTEGVQAVAPRSIINVRDGLRQTTIDLMQLVRLIETGGVDVDGDAQADLDPSRIYYFGQSFGGIYGAMLLGVEPAVRAGVLNVPGGAIIEISRLGGFRPLAGLSLAVRIPPLLNSPPFAPPLWGFNENMPLRNLPAVTNTVPGAIAIQNFFDRVEWVNQSGDPTAYAPHIGPKPVIVQIAKGDQTVPNPTNTALIRAGDLADRTTYYRHDLAFAANPTLSKNPHTFLTNIASAGAAPFALGAQAQIGTFFVSDGAITNDPDGPGPVFETPILPPLPEGLNFIP